MHPQKPHFSLLLSQILMHKGQKHIFDPFATKNLILTLMNIPFDFKGKNLDTIHDSIK